MTVINGNHSLFCVVIVLTHAFLLCVYTHTPGLSVIWFYFVLIKRDFLIRCWYDSCVHFVVFHLRRNSYGCYLIKIDKGCFIGLSNQNESWNTNESRKNREMKRMYIYRNLQRHIGKHTCDILSHQRETVTSIHVSSDWKEEETKAKNMVKNLLEFLSQAQPAPQIPTGRRSWQFFSLFFHLLFLSYWKTVIHFT